MTAMMPLGRSRRTFLGGAGSAFVIGMSSKALARPPWPANIRLPPQEHTPDFSLRLPTIAGIRPHRKGSYRLELEEYGNKVVIHNYGHSGAGITMSWGCADVIRNWIAGRPDLQKLMSQENRIAILGAGVMGMTAAYILMQQYKQSIITLYARDFTPNTTSDVAGGQWLPSSVEYYKCPNEVKKYNYVLRSAYTSHQKFLGEEWGVSWRTNYDLRQSFDGYLERLIPEKTATPLPFACMKMNGWAYRTMLIEPPIFLKKLYHELCAQANIRIRPKTFHSFADVDGLDERLIINCTGLGATSLFPDNEKMYGIKGHLARLEPQRALQYLFSGHGFQYMFPRKDAVIIGGTYEEQFDSELPDPAVGNTLVDRLRATFEGRDGVRAPGCTMA